MRHYNPMCTSWGPGDGVEYNVADVDADVKALSCVEGTVVPMKQPNADSRRLPLHKITKLRHNAATQGTQKLRGLSV